jgi:hypothetical protein
VRAQNVQRLRHRTARMPQFGLPLQGETKSETPPTEGVALSYDGGGLSGWTSGLTSCARL